MKMKDMFPAENIYNLIPREEVKPSKPPRYTSTFRESVKAEEQKNKAAWKTLGPAKVEVPSPKDFLHKHTNEFKLAQKSAAIDPTEKPPRCLDEERRRPPVPRRTEQPIMGVQTNKSFIKTNVADAVMAVPKKPQPIIVDSKKGDKQLLETSGLVPKYIKKKDYGAPPEYLVKRNEEIKMAQEEYDAYVKERIKMGAMKQLAEEERQSALEGLKKNWDELHHEYQALSVVIDTLPKKAHKERLEEEMRQLERDIDLIERHKMIYIANK
ncbi:enkurin [Bombina bombina]|uniref:enkurin n=1 Tax=Bombina bombina TaxID=8345 RepID=UPI00235B1F52|nr:enkurin [Bombina bombina]